MKKLVLMSLTVAGFALSAVGCASQKAEEPTNTMPASSVSTQNNDAATVSSAPAASNDASSQSTVPQSSTSASDVATTMAQ